ncbi:DUF4362 domain-containing protein [Viridibacillus sp. NPDC096237]|uniref:DUF4362 domain-containing protein n=1 Tax=Viridibacillus sp. NPDC096237 TaxID=3390721 RepID=UPI003D027804
MRRFGLILVSLFFLAGCNLPDTAVKKLPTKLSQEQLIKQQQKNLKGFVKKVEEKETAILTINNFTIEGAPITETINFDGEKLTVKRDSTKDPFGSKEIVTYQCEKLEEVSKDIYQLNNCSKEGELIDYYLGNITEQTDEEPPAILLEVAGKRYTTFRGAYCWSKVGKSTCVDHAGPLETLADKNPIKVPANTQIMFNIQSDNLPNTVNLYDLKHDQQTAVTMQDEGLITPKEKGVYYYSYEAKWEKSLSHAYGDVSFAFVIEVE